MCPAIVIIADDLTGAADCGIACTMEGLNTVVIFGDLARANGIIADAIAFDADTRRLSPDDAAAATERAVRELCAGGGVRVLYKKIDSTLRGNFAVEIAAARRAVIGLLADSEPGVAPLAIVAPAFPAAGRTTHGGRMFLNDMPLETSEVWRNDKIEGVGDIPALLERAAGLRAQSVELKTIRAGAKRLAAALDEHAAAKVHAIVCDAETDNDLSVIAQAGVSRRQPTIFAGSAGLARHLPRAFDLIRVGTLKSETAKTVATPTAPLLFIIGSMSQVSREQLRTLAGEPGIRSITIAPAALRNGPTSSEWRQVARLVSEALDIGEDVALALSLDEGINSAESALLSAALAQFLLPLTSRLGGLLCTGGETARALLDASGAAGIRLIGEVEPGVPLGTAVGWRDLPIVTKAGAFGTARTLVLCRAALRRLLRGDLSTSSYATPMKNYSLPTIGITMGDAAGVGPEIIMKALDHAGIYERCRPLVIGDAARLREAGRIVRAQSEVSAIDDPADASFTPGTVDCIDLRLIPGDLPWGKLSAVCGDAAYRYLARAVELAKAGKIDAICTAPLNKEALQAGGHIFPGHTEMLAHLTGTPEVSMMLSTPKLKVIHVTTHIGLIDAVAKIEPGLVERTIIRAYDTLVQAGIRNPRIGVCGINPHAGEHGLFGYGEEESKIEPAIQVCRARGWNVEGPLPADTLFFRAGRGDFDIVVAMYHDQGHGPVKVLGIEDGVNITVGLPVIRTSVDHGTAFDIAGTGKADERSLLVAIEQAIELAPKSPPLGKV